MVRVNGRAIEDYKDYDVRESGLAVPRAEPLYRPAISNGIPADDFVIDDSLALYLPLYALKGSKFKSVDRYGHLCSVTGALWKPYGRAYDGDDKILVANHSAFNFTSEAFTLEIVIYFNSLSGSDKSLFANELYKNYGYYLVVETANGRLYFRTNQLELVQATESTVVVVTDEWMHVAVVRDAASVLLYHNLSNVTETAGSHVDPVTSLSDLGIGRRSVDNYGPVDADVGEVRVYGKALTLGELTRNYNACMWRYQ